MFAPDRSIRHIACARPREVFLTFDDGPVAGNTDRVLDVLEKHGAHATFFVIANRATREKSLINRMQKSGHVIGNHSLDHDTKMFFRGVNAVSAWVARAQEELAAVIGYQPYCFRSPVGIQTPALHKALERTNLPLVHWNVRFYDTFRPWSEKKALQSLDKLQTGSIILLHDRMSPRSDIKRFCDVLDTYLQKARERNFTFSALQACHVVSK